ncbi:hypothetical protein AWV80_37150 [Cupriavidus sp. UYMU48A]|nr:hypothetical protein AWV80_37150 [Cupriavidus sp. UYMU48A]
MRLNLPVTDEEYRLPSDEVIITRTDAQGNIEYANQAFFRSSGYDRAEIIGQPQNIIRHPDMPAAAFADMWATIRAGTPWTGVVRTAARTAASTGCWPTSRPCSRTASRRATCR